MKAWEKGEKYHQGLFRPLNPRKYCGNPTQIVYRSGWEFKVMSWLDRTPAVLEWSSEEIWIPYLSPKDNKTHRYFPDFKMKIQTKNGIETHIIEVKPQKQIEPPKQKKKATPAYMNAVVTYAVNQAKWEYARKYCEQKGYKFTLLNEYDLGLK